MCRRMSVGLKLEPVEIRQVRAAVDGFCERFAVSHDLRARARLAVTEAATNCVLHAYGRDQRPEALGFIVDARIDGDELVIHVRDGGIGARDLQSGVQPGLGLRIIDRVADAVYVSSKPGRGTHIGMRFLLCNGERTLRQQAA